MAPKVSQALQIAGISKAERVACLLEILKGSGGLSTPEIVDRLIRRIGLGNESAARKSVYSTVYRDLTELERSGRLTVLKEAPDGLRVNPEDEDLDPKKTRGSKAIWSLSTSERGVSGSNLLAEIGGILLANDSLLDEMKIEEVTPNFKIKPDRFYVAFSVGPIILALSVCWIARPIKILIGRRTPDFESDAKRQALQDSLGRTGVALLLPLQTLSGFVETRTGHYSIELDRSGEVRLSDLGSTNGTEVLAASNEAARRGIRLLENFTVHTLKQSRNRPFELDGFFALKSGVPVKLDSTGAIVKVTDATAFVLLAPPETD